ncbi:MULTISPECIES: FtsK/SpoIIIE domain-containing protein [Streptomyces]|uniref:FtsK/SpoIIIE domain-containing protein n=1 Tax=Streptomyces TaxID=1883 RepID=UPI00210AC934|nr:MULTISPECIES: FtsK/SpoIIIE domain-containing protein [Streptomyces]UUA11598.1 FtsK/SpoIIIE domain-containing protein [Streptomyces koelreuteriae]UUA19197.1 FtsK/SpoIIIE domain-containing protein [Streptomyces sp. CRCS-T-1]
MIKTPEGEGVAKQKKQQEDELYGQAAGAIGMLAIAAGVLAAIKDKLGLSWPATLALTTGALVALGYGAWKARTALQRLRGGVTQPATAVKQDAPAASAEGLLEAVPEVPVHPEMTDALRTAGVIDKAEVIRADEFTIAPVLTGQRYDFLLPKTRTVQDMQKRLDNVAAYFGVSRLQLALERSRDNERRVKLLKLDAPPFTTPFPAPTRREIETFAGVPLGHDVTGELAGVPTFDKASMLIAGMSQMGKTTLINGLITCLLLAYGEFEMYLLDGKICGLIAFEKNCVRYEATDDPTVFENMVDELAARGKGRYQQKQEAKRNRNPDPKFKPVFFIVDEVANFFADDGTPKGKEKAQRIEEKARKLVAMALESGISTIFMTQRPDKDAIPVKVRSQFVYRLCLYVDSIGSAKVALGDSYFETVAPINPTQLNPDLKGQGVLFAGGTSTLIRGFNFADEFMWEVVDEMSARQHKVLEAAPQTPVKQAIDLMQEKGVEFMPTAELAPALGITENDPVERGKKLAQLLEVAAGRGSRGIRGYKLADLTAAAMSDS